MGQAQTMVHQAITPVVQEPGRVCELGEEASFWSDGLLSKQLVGVAKKLFASVLRINKIRLF